MVTQEDERCNRLKRTASSTANHVDEKPPETVDPVGVRKEAEGESRRRDRRKEASSYKMEFEELGKDLSFAFPEKLELWEHIMIQSTTIADHEERMLEVRQEGVKAYVRCMLLELAVRKITEYLKRSELSLETEEEKLLEAHEAIKNLNQKLIASQKEERKIRQEKSALLASQGTQEKIMKLLADDVAAKQEIQRLQSHAADQAKALQEMKEIKERLEDEVRDEQRVWRLMGEDITQEAADPDEDDEDEADDDEEDDHHYYDEYEEDYQEDDQHYYDEYEEDYQEDDHHYYDEYEEDYQKDGDYWFYS